MKLLIWGVLVLALLLNLSPAFAGDATSISIPVGDWVAASLPFLAWVFSGLAAWGLRHLPAMMRTAMVEQLLAKAIDFALNAVAGASKDKILSAKIGNEVIARAMSYAIQYGPAWVLKFLGGDQGLRARIIARLDLHQDVQVISNPAVLHQPEPAQ